MSVAKVLGAVTIVTVLVVAAVLLREWSPEAPETARAVASSPSSLESQASAGEDGMLPKAAPVSPRATHFTIPHRYRFGSIESIEVAENTDQLLGRYAGEDLTYLISFYHGFTPEGSGFDVLDFRSREGLLWLVENGYPMPAEVLESRRLSDSELLELAREGNVKAQMFYVDRTATTIGSPPTGTTLTPDQIVAGGEWTQTLDEVVASGSPFAGYLTAKARLRSGKGGGAAAGYQLATFLGDHRAQSAVSTLSEAGADASTELAVFHGLLLTLSRKSDVNRVLRSSDPGFPEH